LILQEEQIMSVETQRRRVLSEWRIIMVSQTTYPIMYQIERPNRWEENPRWFAEGYATVKIPIGNRILTKWQEQVRPLDHQNNQWYVVREWTEAEM
jgi:hypothetical protein